MNKTHNKFYYSWLLITSLLFTAVSCADKELGEFIPERMFTPAGLDVETTDISATLSWPRSLFAEGTVTYTLEVSKDSMFQGTVHITKQIDSLRYVVNESDVEVGSKYFARVRANATGAAEASHWVHSPSFIITGEKLLLPVAAADLTMNSVVLKWNPGTVTHIMLNGVRHDITPSEATAGEKSFTGLTPKTDYTAMLYNNTLFRGSQSFRTPANIPTGPLVVVVGATDSLGAMLKTAVNGNIFVLLEGAQQFYDDQIILPEGVSVTIFGEDVPTKPVVAFNGITLPANAGTITFENIDLTGYQHNDPTKTKRNYIFNQSAASNTDQVIFENCIIRNFTNTPFRMQGSNAITINKLVFNNCVAYDCGDNNANGTYAFIHTNVATGKVNNIEITNSTLYKIGYSIILHNAAPSQSVLIENCTFDNIIGNGRYFVDYNAQSAGTFNLRNCIIGKTLSPAATARGIRTTSIYTVDNTYKTADAVISANPITNIIDYAGNSDALWTNPAGGIFTIKDNTFPGKTSAGDPRWR
jgi:hypothetical protein